MYMDREGRKPYVSGINIPPFTEEKREGRLRAGILEIKAWIYRSKKGEGGGTGTGNGGERRVGEKNM
jgi:hypothetical protein